VSLLRFVEEASAILARMTALRDAKASASDRRDPSPEAVDQPPDAFRTGRHERPADA
jgi:hypothetical protein